MSHKDTKSHLIYMYTYITQTPKMNENQLHQHTNTFDKLVHFPFNHSQISKDTFNKIIDLRLFVMK